MKTTRYTKARIMGVLRHMAGGLPAAGLCRAHGNEVDQTTQVTPPFARHP